MAKDQQDTRSEILNVAREQFIAHGYDGARLQTIADGIGVTKAMIHYYFNTKQELFEQVYRRSAEQIFGKLSDTLDSDEVLFKKIESLIEDCLQIAKNEPEVVSFVITEGTRKADWLQPAMEDQITVDLQGFDEELQKAASNYQIAAVDAHVLLIQIFSLCYYPVLSRNINRSLFKEAVDEEMPSKGIVMDTILNWLTA
ncbi:transcriptional regulator, TetR family [Fodinibius salinus]|uniref:Transcriptional regulator, TetR family n=1 Tax=Fodinibius salinus TaxID=860790 RepID=A0A5D3YJC4_9BACT|nr:TetR/AcrR family transcriptional regulator [Fodinibius salinus]TYP93662.1 transcriptional regulator, TetR family [Fodinibius salinus]